MWYYSVVVEAEYIVSKTIDCKQSVFKYARAVKQKVWNEAENRELESYSRLARVRLLRHALPISLLILRKNPTVLQSTKTTPKKIFIGFKVRYL